MEPALRTGGGGPRRGGQGRVPGARADDRGFNGSLLYEPWRVLNKEEKPYRVFTPFWKACLALREQALPCRNPPDPRGDLAGILPGGQWRLEPKIDWAQGIRAAWTPGCEARGENLGVFLDEALEGYEIERDGRTARARRASLLSAVRRDQPRRCRRAVQEFSRTGPHTDGAASAGRICGELGWREFAYYLCFIFPFTADQPLDEKFAAFPWREDREALTALAEGEDGVSVHRRGDAGIVAYRLDAQPRAHGGGVVFGEGPAHSLAGGGRVVWRYAGGRGPGEQHPGLAVDRGLRDRRRAIFPDFQSRVAGEKFDPAEPLHARVGSRTGQPARPVDPQTLGSAGERIEKSGRGIGEGLSFPMVDHAAARPRALDLYNGLKKKT